MAWNWPIKNNPPIWWLFADMDRIWLSWVSFDDEFQEDYINKFPFKFIMQLSTIANDVATKAAGHF